MRDLTEPGQVMERAALVACMVAMLAGCDTDGDEPITTTDVGILASACRSNGGMKMAERVRPMFKAREWRIDCADGARFVLPEQEQQ